MYPLLLVRARCGVTSCVRARPRLPSLSYCGNRSRIPSRVVTRSGRASVSASPETTLSACRRVAPLREAGVPARRPASERDKLAPRAGRAPAAAVGPPCPPASHQPPPGPARPVRSSAAARADNGGAVRWRRSRVVWSGAGGTGGVDLDPAVTVRCRRSCEMTPRPPARRLYRSRH